MADMYELVLDLNLGADLTEDEIAELRWHVGQGAQPERLPLGTDKYLATFPLGDPDDPDCEWETEPVLPVFAQRGPAQQIGGALTASLLAKEDAAGWVLSVRQELHPDDFYRLRTLLDWLGPRAVGTEADNSVGYLRFYESTEPTPLTRVDGRIRVPASVEEHTPLWQPAQ